MDEYVSRELVKERFKKRLNWLKKDIHDEYSLGLYDGCEYDTKLIDEIPAADAVPVVRCRECKHYDGKWMCKISGVPSRKQNDFCSYGERKERC